MEFIFETDNFLDIKNWIFQPTFRDIISEWRVLFYQYVWWQMRPKSRRWTVVINADMRNLTDDLKSKEPKNWKLKAFFASILTRVTDCHYASRRSDPFLFFDLAIRLKAFSWIIHRSTRITMCRLPEWNSVISILRKIFFLCFARVTLFLKHTEDL